MPISDQHECVFVHIPRTGGTTIEKLLGIHRDWPEIDLEVFHGRYEFDDDYYHLQHMSYPEMGTVRDISHSREYFKFTIVRNPWERLVSEYFWQNLQDSISFPEFVSRAARIVKNRIKLKGAYCHFRPQFEFLSNDLDRVLRFENFTNEVKMILQLIGSDIHEVPHFGKTKHAQYSNFYDAEMINAVAEIYRVDIERFGYVFEA